MDSDRTIQKFKRYQADFRVEFRIGIVADDFFDAVRKFDSLFEDNGIGDVCLDPDVFEYVEKVVRVRDACDGTVWFLFDAVTRYITEIDDSDDAVFETRACLVAESEQTAWPEWVVKDEIRDVDLVRKELICEDYRD